MTSATRLTWLLLGLLCVVGCNQRRQVISATTIRSCTADSGCLTAEMCVFEQCSPVCVSDRDCRNGAICFDAGRGLACVSSAATAGSGAAGGSAGASGASTSGASGAADGGRSGAAAGAAGAADSGAADSGAADSGSASQSCPPGSVQCDENVVTRCDDDGKPLPEESCAFVCEAGACSGDCSPGDRRCEGKDRQRCDDTGAWQVTDTCPNVCTPDACVSTCSEGERQCNGTALMICRGGAMVEDRACEFVCTDGACSGECKPGEKQCRNNGVATCSSQGRWDQPVECLNACVGGACTGQCTPGAQRCGGLGGYQICDDRGSWGQTIECKDQACEAGSCTGVCSPGAIECESNTARHTCERSGQWGPRMACMNSTCMNGACSGECAPQAKRCRPGNEPQVEMCTAQGSWQAGERCEDGICRDGACAGECSPDARRCDANNPRAYQTCEASGMWGSARTCETDRVCGAMGQCQADPCPTGRTPDWFSSARPPGDPSLNDSRWGGGVRPFEGAPPAGAQLAGYLIVYDRRANMLAVTLRAAVAPGQPRDAASSADYVYFGIGAMNGAASAARIALVEGGQGNDPRPLNELRRYQWSNNSWGDSSGRPAWLRDVAAWTEDQSVSWAVSFRVDLAAGSFDVTQPLRIALGLHGESETEPTTEVDFTTPRASTVEQLSGQNPTTWRTVNLSQIQCTGNVTF
jgi:hypothetical protein